MTEVIINNERRLIEVSRLGIPGPVGASFHVVDDVSELTPEMGNNHDTAITVVDGHEYQKNDGQWITTGRLFWGTLLEDVTEAGKTATSAASVAGQWAANPEDAPVEDGLFSARHYALKTAALASSSLQEISAAKNTSLDALENAFDAVLRDMAAARLAVLQEVEDSSSAAKEYRRLTGLDATATADDRVTTTEHRRLTGLDATATSDDRTVVNQIKADVVATAEILRSVLGVYLWRSDGQSIATGGYIATVAADTAGVFDRISLSVPNGIGKVLVQLLINGRPASQSYEISAGIPLNLTNQSINIAQGDSVVFAVLSGTASQLWAQITGLLK